MRLCKNPGHCARHPVHRITSDEYVRLDREKVEKTLVYVVGETANVPEVEFSHVVVGANEVPAIVELNRSGGITAMAK